jgi:pimeloyl-ACP methyl ester carboxylesterase
MERTTSVIFVRALQVCFIATAFLPACVGSTAAQSTERLPKVWKEGYVNATDGVEIHYVEAGKARTTRGIALSPRSGPGPSVGSGGPVSEAQQKISILFVPGWTMPAWIWEKQIAYFSREYHAVAMDPRAQGESDKTSEGLYPAQMARDIHSVIEQLQLAPVVIVGWSMAIVETLAYVDQSGTKDGGAGAGG